MCVSLSLRSFLESVIECNSIFHENVRGRPLHDATQTDFYSVHTTPTGGVFISLCPDAETS